MQVLGPDALDLRRAPLAAPPPLLALPSGAGSTPAAVWAAMGARAALLLCLAACWALAGARGKGGGEPAAQQAWGAGLVCVRAGGWDDQQGRCGQRAWLAGGRASCAGAGQPRPPRPRAPALQPPSRSWRLGGGERAASGLWAAAGRWDLARCTSLPSVAMRLGPPHAPPPCTWSGAWGGLGGASAARLAALLSRRLHAVARGSIACGALRDQHPTPLALPPPPPPTRSRASSQVIAAAAQGAGGMCDMR